MENHHEIIYCGYLYPVEAFSNMMMEEKESKTPSKIIYSSSDSSSPIVYNNQQQQQQQILQQQKDSNTISDVNYESSQQHGKLQIGQPRWFEIHTDYHLYQYKTRPQNNQQNINHEMKTNLLQYHHILPLNYTSYSQKSFYDSIIEVYAQQTSTSYQSPLLLNSGRSIEGSSSNTDHVPMYREEQEDFIAPISGDNLCIDLNPSSSSASTCSAMTTPRKNSDALSRRQSNDDEDSPALHPVIGNSNRKFTFCCKSDDQQEVLLLSTDSEQKRSEWICVLKHLLFVGMDKSPSRFISLGGNCLVPISSNVAKSTEDEESTLDLECYKKELTSFVEGLTRKIQKNEQNKREREERSFILQQQSLILRESIKGLSSFSSQSPPRVESASNNLNSSTNMKNLSIDRIFHIESLNEEINRTRLELLTEKIRVLSEIDWTTKPTCTYNLPFSQKSNTKPQFQYLLTIEEKIREHSPLYFKKSIQLSRLLLAYEWRHLILSLNDISKELSRWNTENLKQLDHLYTQSFELNTTKKTLSSTYQEIAGRYNLYTQAYGVTNEGSQIRLDTNTSSALNGLRQTIQEVHANLSDATTKLKQTSNQISLIMYQLGLIENLLIKVVNTQRFATNCLRYGNLVSNNIPQRLFVLDDNFEIEREMRSLIDMPSKNDLIDICFFKLTSRHIIEKFKSRIERGDSYLLQLKHIKEDIQSEIKSQQLASSEERKKHASQMVKQMQQRLRNTITSGQHSNFFCTQIHQFVQKFLNSPVNTTVGNQKLQDFLKALTEKVSSMIKINLSWYQVYEVLESMTFEYTSQTRGMIMYDCSLCQVRNEMKMMDEAFYVKCLDVSNKLVGQLLLESKKIDEKDLHDNEYRQFIIDEEMVKFKEEYKTAIDLIRTISEDSHDKVSDTKPYSPSAKLNIITLAAKEVMNKIYFSKTKQPLKSEGDQFVSADDFIPVFICVICVAATKDMFTQIGFIKEFAYQDYLVGEQGFFLSSLESGSFYIVNYEDESHKLN
ncbi:predicted protein [Naegleria gruberi]|uniref:Predicted protein n=1 Tax=Naegleria gruberi TaxID=5762 RepID=D2VFD1_NAEGR|nr:uncharacterized protein NAEGRDRAFT_79743 [Naegleria gruberi]EFC44437.1 predicted protein [Naegleria gruberi]|eukprot:XP_002677181.1 predicted protein [Naegleria gruberi strain NEG-M]